MVFRLKSKLFKFLTSKSGENKEKLRIFLTWALIPFAFILGLLATYTFLQNSRQFTISNIEKNTAVVVSNKVQDIENFMGDKFSSLEKISNNEYVRLYLSQMVAVNGDLKQDGSFDNEISFLNAYSEKVATISGFRDTDNDNFQKAINSPYRYNDGITIFDANGGKITAISNTPDVSSSFVNSLAFKDVGSGRLVDDISFSQYHVPILNFAVPIYKIDSEKTKANIIGWAVGTMEIDSRFFSMIYNDSDIYSSYHHYIVRREDDSVRYLTPVENYPYDASLEKLIPMNDKDKMEMNFFYGSGKLFFSRDFESNKIMGFSKKIKGMNWYFVRTFNTDEALSSINSRIRSTFVMFSVIFLFILMFFVWTWKFGASVRVLKFSKEKDIALKKYKDTSLFLRMVADSQEDEIIVVNANNEILFANRRAERKFADGFPTYLSHGKRVLSFGLNFDRTEKIKVLNREALESHVIKTAIHNWLADGVDDEGFRKEEHFRTLHIPLEGEMVLISFHNLTHIFKEKEHEFESAKGVLKFMSEILSFKTVMSPFKIDYVYSVCQDLVAELGLGKDVLENLRLASYLVDANKFFLSQNILDKLEIGARFTKVEEDAIRISHDKVANILKSNGFENKVNFALLHKSENYDGTGFPSGLAGEDICLEARILRVAEDFVEMLIHKNRLLKKDISEALTHMMMNSEELYDARVVSALLNFANNKGGIRKWEHMTVEKSHVLLPKID